MSDADANQVFSGEKTIALANAALAGDESLARKLVTEGADPNEHGKDQLTLLQWAMLRQNLRAMGILLDVGAQAGTPGWGGDTVLHLAAKANDLRYLKLLLAHGADPNAPDGKNGAPPLDAALINDSDEAMQDLLAHHADPNRADHGGNTPLHIAAQLHRSDRLLQLLKAGAKPDARNAAGKTFQPYFNLQPAGGRNPQAKASHDAVQEWLREHGVAVEGT